MVNGFYSLAIFANHSVSQRPTTEDEPVAKLILLILPRSSRKPELLRALNPPMVFFSENVTLAVHHFFAGSFPRRQTKLVDRRDVVSTLKRCICLQKLLYISEQLNTRLTPAVAAFYIMRNISYLCATFIYRKEIYHNQPNFFKVGQVHIKNVVVGLVTNVVMELVTTVYYMSTQFSCVYFSFL